MKVMLNAYVGQVLTPEIEAELRENYPTLKVVRPGESVNVKEHWGAALVKVDEESKIIDTAVL